MRKEFYVSVNLNEALKLGKEFNIVPFPISVNLHRGCFAIYIHINNQTNILETNIQVY